MTPVPRLLGLSTAVPPYQLGQADVVAQAHGLFAGGPPQDLERLLPVYLNAGIETRYSCVPLEWYTRPHGWAEKNHLYLENAVALIETATLDCLARAGLGVGDVDMVVSVSTTGIATPSLDALLAERLDMRRDVQRLPVFGLGCAGGVLGLARAAAMAQASPGATVPPWWRWSPSRPLCCHRRQPGEAIWGIPVSSKSPNQRLHPRKFGAIYWAVRSSWHNI